MVKWIRPLAWMAIMASATGPMLGAEPDDRASSVRIAALPFTLAAGDQRFAPLAGAIGDLLMVQISKADSVVLVERSAVDRAIKELQLATAFGPATQSRFGKMLGAQFVLTGSLTASGENLQLAAHLLEVETARVARSAKVSACADRLVEPVDKLARQLAGTLRRDLPRLSHPQIDQSPEANLHFMRALGYYYAGMPEQATTQFMRTLAIDPDHAEARFYNGMTYLEGAKERGHARIEFAHFLRRFPDHRLAPLAKQKLRRCEEPRGDSSEETSP